MREVLVHLNVEVPDGDKRSANEIADAVEAALKSSQGRQGPTKDYEALNGLVIVCPLAEDLDGPDVTTLADVHELVTPDDRRWQSRKPGIYPGPDDEVVKVELSILYPGGFALGPAYKVGRWWPEEGAALDADGDGFGSMHGQYRLADNAATAMAHLAEFAHAACAGAILRWFSKGAESGVPE